MMIVNNNIITPAIRFLLIVDSPFSNDTVPPIGPKTDQANFCGNNLIAPIIDIANTVQHKIMVIVVTHFLDSIFPYLFSFVFLISSDFVMIPP